MKYFIPTGDNIMHKILTSFNFVLNYTVYFAVLK